MMRVFLKKLASFMLILIAIVLIGVLLPATPRASTSHLFGRLKTDSLLENVSPPRLILLGGSNTGMGINSQMLKDSLNLNPINTGVSYALGFAYYFDHTLPYIRRGDIVVVSIEYIQFYHRNVYGSHDLVRNIFDIAPSELFKLRWQQVLGMYKYIPQYAISKFKITEYYFERDPLAIYDESAINKYGGNRRHWYLESQGIDPEEPLPKEFDQYAFDLLNESKQEFEKKGAKVFFTFPGLQQSTFYIQKKEIKSIEDEYKRLGFTLLGNPERYVLPDSLFFDTAVHPIQPGVDLRTGLLIEDLKSALVNIK